MHGMKAILRLCVENEGTDLSSLGKSLEKVDSCEKSPLKKLQILLKVP